MQEVDALDGLALLCRTSSGEVVAPARRLNTENTETLYVLSGEALKALSTQRSSLWLRHGETTANGNVAASDYRVSILTPDF
jgi:hypothetical protein